MQIGHSLTEIMHNMTLQTTDFRDDQYITALFFCRGGKNSPKIFQTTSTRFN
jgi:hypothetical protein